jgi:hypothetical protein
MPSTARAQYEGCPDTWILKTEQLGSDLLPSQVVPSVSEQLQEIQKTLGTSNMIIKPATSSSVVNFAGESGPIDEKILKRFPSGMSAKSFGFLYGRSIINETYVVEVRGCANPGLFNSRKYLNTNFTYSNSTAADWVKLNSWLFLDFKKEQEFLNQLALMESKIKSEAESLVRWPREGRVTLPTLFPFMTGRGLTRISINTIPQSPNCTNLVGDRNLYLELGSICKFAFSANLFSANSVVFETFEIDGRFLNKTINCVKGKVTKKVTAVNPKCPTGYKKK